MKELFSSLRVRLVLLVLIAVIPALGLIVYSAMEERRQESKQVNTDALRLSQLVSGDVERFIEGARQMLISLAETQVVRTRDSGACNQRFTSLRKQYRHYLNIAATDAAGNFFASAVPLPRPVNSADRPWFQRAVRTRNFALGDFQVGRITGTPSINCSYPVFDHKGRLLGVLMAAVDLAWLAQVAKEANLPEGATLTVVDRRGTILARYPNPQQWMGKTVPEANLVKTILTQKEGLEEVTGIDGIKRLYGFTPVHGAVDTGLYLGIGLSKEIAFKEIDRILYRNLAVLGLAAALALMVAWLVGDRLILRQVKALVDAAKHLRNGDLSARTGLPYQNGEISQLAHAFDEMAEALEQRAIISRQAEARIGQLNRLLSTISGINQLIVREDNRERFLSETCNILVILGQFQMAWIGMADFATGKVLPIAHAGIEEGYLKEIQIRFDETPHGRGPTGTAIRENKTIICDDTENDPNFVPWREAARKYGYRSSAAIPIAVGGVVVGALNLYAAPRSAFGEEEKKLLEELAGDIGYALKNFQEIEERRQAEEALRESEKRYRQLLETITDYIYTVKVENGRAVSTAHGSGCVTVTGYTAEDYEADPLLWLRMVYEEDQPRVMEQNAKIMAGEWAPPLEHRIIHHDGTIRWVRNTPVRRYDEQKRLIAYDGLVTDITERKRAEEEIYLKAQLLDNANDSIFLHDLEGNFIYFNETAYKSRGYKKNELMTMNLRNLVPPQYADLFSLRVQELKEKGNISFESKHFCKDGTEMPIEVNARVLESGGKKLVLSVIRDITERREAEEVLRRYTERFYKTFQANPAAISIATYNEGRFLDMNDSFLRLLGFTREEIVGRTAVEVGIWPKPEDRQRIIKLLEQQPSIRELEVAYGAKSGGLREGLASFELLELGGEKYIIAMFHDLTERKHLEAQLVQSQKIEAVGTLAGGVAHDFNNLLTAMMGNLELAKFKIDTGQPAKTYLEEIENIVQRAALLTQQLLAFSRRQIIQPVPLDMNDTISNVSKILSRLIGEHIELTLQLEAKLGTVKADPAQLEQVIMNLCVNARDAMPRGGKLILKTQNVNFDENYITNHPWVQAGNYVLLEVIDTGVGMDQATVARIFEPFFTTKEVGKGTGLGLSMAYGIVKQHEGYIDVYSEPDRGTTFKIYLPIIEEKLMEKEIKETPKKIEGGKETILLAEDEEPLREAIRNILEIFGYTVLTAQDGQEAVEVYEKQKGQIDLVILDAVMPKRGGKEVAERIYRQNPRQKILFTSGYSAEGLHESFTIPQDMHFIQKPYNAKTLAQKVREVLEA